MIVIFIHIKPKCMLIPFAYDFTLKRVPLLLLVVCLWINKIPFITDVQCVTLLPIDVCPVFN